MKRRMRANPDSTFFFDLRQKALKYRAFMIQYKHKLI